MSGFSIGCTTCNARLLVRDASAIGQILACPKCGSMVMVTSHGASLEAPPTLASPAAVPPSDLGESPAAPTPPFAESPSAPQAPPVTEPPPAPQAPPIPQAVTSRLPGLVWIGGGVVGGLVLALGIFFLIAWLGSSDDSSRVVEAGSADAVRTPDTVEVSEPPVAEPSTSPDDAAPKPVESMVDSPVEKPAVAPPAPVVGAASKQGVESETKAANRSPDDLPPAASAAPVKSGPAPSPAAPLRAGQENTKDAEPEGPPDLQPRLAKDTPLAPQPVAGRFAGLLSDGGSDSATTPSPEPRVKPSGKNNDHLLSAVGEEEIVRPRMREIDVPGRLADPIGKLQIKDMPLADFAELLSDMSTIPMTLDADALRMRWIAPSTPVTVNAEQTTVRGVLSAGLEPLQLGLFVSNGHVRITDGSAAEALQRRRSHDVVDLVGADPQQLEILGQWVLELIQPESWTEAGGTGTLKAEKGALVIQNRDAVHFQVLYLCDKLRATRKLPPRGRYAASLLAPGSLPTRAQAPLQTTIKLNFNRSTRLTQILARLGKVANVRILVDWEAVQEAGWTPDSMAKLTVDGKHLSETLALLLGPRDLTYRVIDDGTLEVTTPAAVERHVEWEFYPVGDLLAVDQDPRPLIEQLHDAVGANHFRAFGGSGSIRFDSVSRTLLVALPEPQQRLAAGWLAEKR